MYWLVLMAGLSGCDTIEDKLDEIEIPDHETVYECVGDDNGPVELCSPLSADELSVEVGWPCRVTTDPRFCLGPLDTFCFQVCLYSCETGHRGCNALNGCYCPTEDQ